LQVKFPFNKEIKRFAGMILNLFVRTLALNITLYLSTRFATGLGTSFIAAYTIGINLWFLGAFVIDGYASAGNILSGKLYGAKQYHLLLQLGKKLIKYGVLLGVFLSFLGFLLYKPIGHLFTQDTAVLDQFQKVFWIILIMQPFCALAFIFDGIFKGLGKMKVLRNVLLLSTFMVFVPALYALDYLNWNLYAVFTAIFIWIIARGLPLIVLFWKMFMPKAENE